METGRTQVKVLQQTLRPSLFSLVFRRRRYLELLRKKRKKMRGKKNRQKWRNQ